MTKLEFNLGKLKIDAPAYGSQGNAVLGIRDSGKTYTATEIAEKLFEAGIPFTTFDPTGVWRFLRVPGAGRGYPVVVAGGKDGDLPLTVAGAPEIVRAAMKNGVSIVLDLTDQNLSKADWKRIVKSCVRVMLSENAQHGLRHVFIEEAAEFIPQRVIDGDVYAEVEKLARIGGNSRLGYTLINQRSQEVSKAVLELCENLFLHRQKGKNALDSLAKWFDLADVAERKEIMKSLPNLPSGQCWAWMGGSDEIPLLIKVPPKNSHHPDRRAMRGDVAVLAKSAVDVGSFVSSMKVSLVEIEETDKANDPKLLRAEIARLTALTKAPTNIPQHIPDAAQIAAAQQHGYEIGRFDTMATGIKEVDDIRKAVENGVHQVMIGVVALDRAKDRAEAWVKNMRQERTKPGSPASGKASAPARAPIQPAARKPSPAASGDGTLSGPQRKIVEAIHFWDSVGTTWPTREQVAAVAGYSARSGSFRNTISSLNVAGYISGDQPGCLGLNGPAHSLGLEPIDASARLKSILSGPESKIVGALLGPVTELSRQNVADDVGYSAESGSFRNTLSSLHVKDVIRYPSKGTVALTDWAKQVLA